MDITLKPGEKITIHLLDETGEERDKFFLTGGVDEEVPERFRWAAWINSDEYGRGSGSYGMGGSTHPSQKKKVKVKK